MANGKLTKAQVIDRIMDVITALPDAVKELPEKLRTRAEWEKTFSGKNPAAAPILEVLQELPAFTEHAPKARTAAAWRKVFARHMGLEQIAGTLRNVHGNANHKLIHRPRIVYWRDAFGPDEKVQRVRPKEHFEYIHNPHRGTTTFQRFQGEDTYPSFITADTHGPVEFPRTNGRVPENVKMVPRTTLTYCRWPWAWLEPRKGRFNWKLIDATLRTARERGQTAQLRFQPYTQHLNTEENPPKAKRYPKKSSVNVPDWYWDTGAKWISKGVYAKNRGPTPRAPRCRGQSLPAKGSAARRDAPC